MLDEPQWWYYCAYVLLVVLAIAVITGVRLVTRRGATSALVGLNVATISASVMVLVLGRIVDIPYSREIALCLFFFGTVGIIMFSRYLRSGTLK